MKKKIIFLFVLFSISSCRINGNLKGLFSNYKKSNFDQPNLYYHAKINEEISNIKLIDNNKVIIINGQQIKKHIAKYQKSLIYIWEPNCKGTLCAPPDIIQRNCDIKKIELFIVSEYYDNKQMEINYNLKNPIFGIDVKYYKTNLTTKYLLNFKSDLAIIEVESYRYLYFEKGKYKKSYENFNDIK